MIWRSKLAWFPENLREKWGLLANYYESRGLSWKDAEYKAFSKICKFIAKHNEENPNNKIIYCDPAYVIKTATSNGTSFSFYQLKPVLEPPQESELFVPDMDGIRFIVELNEAHIRLKAPKRKASHHKSTDIRKMSPDDLKVVKRRSGRRMRHSDRVADMFDGVYMRKIEGN